MARNYRLEIIEALGGQCQWHKGCTVTDPDMLQIDHVHGGGYTHRRVYSITYPSERTRKGGNGGNGGSNGSYYKSILSAVLNNSQEYQLLCANHNVKKYALERRAKKVAV